MSTLLHIDSSPVYGRSVSRELTAAFVAQWKASHPDGRVIERDLNATAMPPINAEWIGAVYMLEEARTPHQKELLSLSDSLLAGGDGAVEVILTPRVEEGSAVRLDAEIGQIDADGSLGEALRSGLGPALKDKIREALLKAIQKSADFDAVVPAQARPFVAVQSVAFEDGGNGRVALTLAARLQVPASRISSVLEQFRNRNQASSPMADGGSTANWNK